MDMWSVMFVIICEWWDSNIAVVGLSITGYVVSAVCVPYMAGGDLI